MSATKAIYSRLSSTPAITALVGNRIAPETLPQKGRRYPFLVYTGEEIDTVRHYRGTSGLASQMVAVASISKTFAQAEQLSKLVKDAINDQSGTWGGVKVQGAFLRGKTETTETTDAGEDELVHVHELSFLVWFEEA